MHIHDAAHMGSRTLAIVFRIRCIMYNNARMRRTLYIYIWTNRTCTFFLDNVTTWMLRCYSIEFIFWCWHKYAQELSLNRGCLACVFRVSVNRKCIYCLIIYKFWTRDYFIYWRYIHVFHFRLLCVCNVSKYFLNVSFLFYLLSYCASLTYEIKYVSEKEGMLRGYSIYEFIKMLFGNLIEQINC